MNANKAAELSKAGEVKKIAKRNAEIAKQLSVMEEHVEKQAKAGEWDAAFHSDAHAQEMAGHFTSDGYQFKSGKDKAGDTFYYLSWIHLRE